GSNAAPNYIFPMTSAQVCGVNNVEQLSAMLYRPLYWYGNNYSPTVDYNYSIAQKPVFSNGNKTVTVKLNSWKWSDGESVTSRDVEFYVNLYKADPAANYCGYVPGFFPDNVVSMSTPDAQTIVFQLDKAYNPTWFLYNELSQITPLPLAWDRTSLSQPAPTSDTGNLPDSTKAGAESVYKFLDAQSKSVATWASSPLWSVVDGPFKLQSFSNTGEVTLVPNSSYSGSPKPTISKLVEVPFTDDSAEFNDIRSGGPSALTVANYPAAYEPQVSSVESEGYDLNKASSYSFNYFVLNQNNPKVGPVFRQTYFRQALQHLIDQDGWVHAFLHDTATPTYSPIPPQPPSPLFSFNASTNPFPFSTAAASQLLSSHGWKVVPGGTTTCQDPSKCGAGITAGESISFNIDYASGTAALPSEMQDLAAQAKKVGIAINLTTHPFDTVISTATACQPGQPTCNWTAENWGAGWIYAPDFLPTGESLFLTGAAANYENYNDPKANQLIDATVYGTGNETQALTAYAKYMEQSVPVVFGPTSIGTYAGDGGTLISKHLGGYVANAFGYMNPENWYLTK
ncbi:MAG TPA: ABC transporter substrate-binding protein, partial [Acidimicrobiales bacterium]|nr:ABC transporter substrate-binding protein [Acidimicrobiales bacterium]